MSRLDEIARALSVAHDRHFKGHTCESVHEALRLLPDDEWQVLARTWRQHEPAWVCNLAYCLDPDYHPLQAETLLVDILRHGGPDAGALAADTLLLNSLYVPDEEMKIHLAQCHALALQHPDPGTREYRAQVYQSLMAKRPVERLAEAHEFSNHNRVALSDSDEAACYYCRTIFPAREVTEFTDQGETAMCPYCGVDSVLPDSAPYPLNYMTLRALHQYWF